MGSVLATASIATTQQKNFVTIAARARSHLAKPQRTASKQQTKPNSGETYELTNSNWKKEILAV